MYAAVQKLQAYRLVLKGNYFKKFANANNESVFGQLP